MDRISIIVPVYNAEPFLRQSIDCVLNQTYSDFELVLVDDGSKDASGLICDQYAQVDARVKVMHKQNAGASEARNTGIVESTEELITFIDADDVISSDYLQGLYADYKKADDADFVIQGMTQKWPDHDTAFKMGDGIYDMQTEAGIRFFESVKVNDFSGPYCKLYRRSLLNKFDICFSKDIIYAEDFDFMLRYLMHCNTVVASSATNYCYIMHEGSVSSKIYTFDKELSGLQQLYSSYNAIVDRFNSDTLIVNRNKSINDYIWRVIYSNYRHGYTRKQRIENFKKVDNELLEFFKQNYMPRSLFTTVVKLQIANRLFCLLDRMLALRLIN